MRAHRSAKPTALLRPRRGSGSWWRAETQRDAAPAWEATAKPAGNRISANIKPKRKVAALFKSDA